MTVAPSTNGLQRVGTQDSGQNGIVPQDSTTALQIESSNRATSDDIEAPAGVAQAPTVIHHGYKDIFLQFATIGWTAFGGPAAHFGFFQKVFVEKLHWMTSVVFLELMALTQFLPGPSSTQMSFAIGVTQQGTTGGLLSGAMFQYPGFILASLAGAGVAKWLGHPAPWLRGLTAGGLAPAGVALVASAAKQLTYKVCNDKVTMALNTIAAVVTFYYTPTWIFPLIIFLGGCVTLYTKRKEQVELKDVDAVEKLGVRRFTGIVLVLIWLVVLIGSIVLRKYIPYHKAKPLHWFEAFYRMGSLIFGGGQVVLPMIDSAVVAPGWMSADDFFTGLALVQAMPGPLFNVAAYMGAVIAHNAGVNDVVGIVVCWIGLFAPGIILIFGVLPWWGQFRHFAFYRRLLPGFNAAAVGLIVASVFQLGLKVRSNSPFPNASLCIGMIVFALADFLSVPAPIAVIAGGVLGIIGWATGMH